MAHERRHWGMGRERGFLIQTWKILISKKERREAKQAKGEACQKIQVAFQFPSAFLWSISLIVTLTRLTWPLLFQPPMRSRSRNPNPHQPINHLRRRLLLLPICYPLRSGGTPASISAIPAHCSTSGWRMTRPVKAVKSSFTPTTASWIEYRSQFSILLI